MARERAVNAETQIRTDAATAFHVDIKGEKIEVLEATKTLYMDITSEKIAAALRIASDKTGAFASGNAKE